MEAWLMRLYERHGVRYLQGAMTAMSLTVLAVVLPACTFAPSHYLGLDTREYLIVLATAAAWGVLTLVLSFWHQRALLRPLARWTVTRDPRLAATAHDWAFALPGRLVRSAWAIALPFLPVSVTLLLAFSGYDTPLDIAGVTIGAFFPPLLASQMAVFSLDVALRPVRASLGSAIRPRNAEHLARRLLVTLLSLTGSAAVATGYVTTTRAEAGAGNLFTLYAIGLGVTALVAPILWAFLAGTVIGPVRDLTRGARAVAAGDLGAEVPATSADELGELAGAFNEMVDGLRERETLRTRNVELLTRVVAAGTEERRRVERDLHDGAQQHLVLLRLKLGLARRALPADPARGDALLAEAEQDLLAALGELRDLAHGIYPAALADEGLRGALPQAAERAAIPATVSCDGTGRYRPEVETAVYFCCVEALQNAAKHAGPGARARVSLSEAAGRLRFEVADDGRGCDLEAAGGTGLQNMEDRVQALGGSLTFDSAPGAGMRVRGAVPVGDPAA